MVRGTREKSHELASKKRNVRCLIILSDFPLGQAVTGSTATKSDSFLVMLWSGKRGMQGLSSDLETWEVAHSAGMRKGCQMINSSLQNILNESSTTYALLSVLGLFPALRLLSHLQH